MNYGDGSNRFSEVELGDCADAYRVDLNADPFEEGQIIGAAIFRSPEANLQLRWGTATDIWSFGATVSFLNDILCRTSTVSLILYAYTAHKPYMGPKLAHLYTGRLFGG